MRVGDQEKGCEWFWTSNLVGCVTFLASCFDMGHPRRLWVLSTYIRNVTACMSFQAIQSSEI